MLRAAGVPETLAGAVPTLVLVQSCLARCLVSSPDPVWSQWSGLVKTLDSTLREAALDAPHIARPPAASAGGVADLLAQFPRPINPSTDFQALMRLLAQALIASCTAGTEVRKGFVDGAGTLANLLMGRKGSHADWARLDHHNLLDRAALLQLVADVTPKSPAGAFALAAAEVLGMPLAKPRLSADETTSSTSEPDADSKDEPATPRTHAADRAPAEESDKTRDRVPLDTTPRVSARLVLADASTVAEKFGLPSRDALPLAELAHINKALVRDVSSLNPSTRANAVLALVSEVTRCTDALAVNLRFDQRDSIWLEPDCNAWGWDFAEFRRSGGAGGVYGREPVRNTLPKILADSLTQLRAEFPDAESLGELLRRFVGEHWSLEEFRNYVRSLDPSPHPAYRARLARSFACAYLEITRSDMAAALACASFAPVAPAALYYYGPKPQTLLKRISEVFEVLGLGAPAPMTLDAARIGCQKVAEAPFLSSGWNSLVREINTLTSTIETLVPLRHLAELNRLLRLLAVAFVVRTAHRGTRLDRATFGALFLHPTSICVHDKDEDQRHPGRLLPRTREVAAILSAAARCHDHVEGLVTRAADAPVFVQWSVEANGGLTAQPVTTGDIHGAMAEHFGTVDVNFARSTWVTHLDEHGCDRWLIRVLTGHSRDVTRTNGAYFDIPPVVFAGRLGKAMEKLGPILFGSIGVDPVGSAPSVDYVIDALPEPDLAPAIQLRQPRGLLDDIDLKTLCGWHCVSTIRDRFVVGGIHAPPGVLAFLSMKFLDFVPCADLCIDAILQPNMKIAVHGKQAGVLWERAHFKHPTWVPIDASTMALIELAKSEKATGRAHLIREVNKTLLALFPGWPGLGSTHCHEADRILRHFLRLELPPSLQAACRVDVPAPALSQLSLARLAGSAPNAALQLATVPPAALRSTTRVRGTAPTDLAWLRRSTAGFKQTDKRLGEVRQRAADLLKLVESNFSPESAYAVWVGDWLVHELKATQVQQHGCLALSSIYTYLTVLAQGQGAGRFGDPYDWTAEEWLSWFGHLQTLAGQLPEASLTSHVRDATARMVRSLIARGHSVEWEVRKLVLGSEAPVAHSSASSVVVLDEDCDRILALGERWLQDRPLDLLLFRARLTLHDAVPSRAGEVSGLRLECVTPWDGLVIERAGFMLHKNRYAVRVVALGKDVARKVRDLRNELQKFYPKGAEFLLRGQGTQDACVRELQILALFSKAMKVATGDMHARSHSFRARGLQEIAWPGWMLIARAMLKEGCAPGDAMQWVKELQLEASRLTAGCAMAGHSGIGAALGNYLAAWPLILRLQALAMRSQLQPSPRLAEQLGLQGNTFTQARKRAGAPFCGWTWLTSKVPIAHAVSSNGMPKPVQAQSQPDSAEQESTSDQPATRKDPESLPGVLQRSDDALTQVSPPLAEMAYLAARILDLPVERAVDFAGIGLRHALDLETRLPLEDLKHRSVRRARQAPAARGVEGNHRILLGAYPQLPETGGQLIRLVAGLQMPRVLYAWIHGTPLRADPVELIALWTELSHACPSSLSFTVRRSPRHVSFEERETLKVLAPALLWKLDAEIGATPALSLGLRGQDNRVMSSRLTAVLRSVVLARACLSNPKEIVNG
jgi:hypothetical protein